MNWKEDKKFVCLYNSAQKIGEKVQYQVSRLENLFLKGGWSVYLHESIFMAYNFIQERWAV